MSHKVISFHYVVKDSSGTVLDQSTNEDPVAFLTGHNQIIPGLERELMAMASGDKKSVSVAAAEAYGERQDDLLTQVSRDELPEELQVGQMFSVSAEPGGEATHVVTVVEFDDQNVTLDANHPLAGKDLQFDVEITEVRDASAEELDHGHAHGEGGHHHH